MHCLNFKVVSMTKQIPQGYKQTKVGVIPEDWDVVKLNEIVKNVIRDVKKPDDGYWRLGLRSHGKGTFHQYIEDPSKVEMDTLYKVSENDLIVNITFAWEHAIAVANNKDHGKLVSHRFPTYQFINDNYHVFYKYYVLQEKFRLLLENISPGGAGRNRVMSKKSFLDLAIICPPVIEQKKIAEILSTWDDAITKQKQLIEQKQVFKKGIMQQIFSQKIRFKDDNCNAYNVWEEKHLDEICTFFSGGTPTSSNKDYYNGDIPFIGSGNISNNQVEQFITNEALKSSSAKMIEKGDLLLALYGATSGQSAIAKLSGAINQAILCIRTQELKEFIFYWLQLNKDNILSTYLQGGQGNLSAQIIKQLKLELPTLSEQIKIADFLINVDNEISKQTEILNQLKLQKQSLMQKLLTGQVRTKI